MTVSRSPRHALPLACVALLAACATPTDTAPELASPPFCSFAAADETFESLEAMPAGIARDLISRFADVTILSREEPMAKRDDLYNVPDTPYVGLTNRRFIQGARVGETYIVLYEHGGVELHDHAVLFRSDADLPLRAIAAILAQPHELCRDAQALLDDPRDPYLWRNRRDW